MQKQLPDPTLKSISMVIMSCNDQSQPHDGTVALCMNPAELLLSDQQKKNFEEVSDSPKETMKDKVVRAGAEAIKQKVWL